MIVITQVRRSMGDVRLTIEYSTDVDTETVVVEAQQIVDRLKQLRGLVGRKPTVAEAREVVVQLINELRRGREPLVEIIPWENYIGVDLE